MSGSVMTMTPPLQRRGVKVSGYRRHPGSEWIDTNQATLPNNMWVAADGQGFFRYSSSFEGLLSELQFANREEKEVAVAYITEDAQ